VRHKFVVYPNIACVYRMDKKMKVVFYIVFCIAALYGNTILPVQLFSQEPL